MNKKYIAPSKAAEVLSKKLDIPLEDLVDIFAEIPAENLVECKHCGKAIRFPVAFHAACDELAAGAIMEKMCDKYCRFPGECSSKEELDKHCDNCELIEIINLAFKGAGFPEANEESFGVPRGAGKTIWECSECRTLDSLGWKRCPVCEAKMGGKGDKE